MMIAQAAEPVTGSVLNWVDLLCIALLGAFLVYGVIRGFMLQLLGIVVLVGCALLATFLSKPLGQWLAVRWGTLTPVHAKWMAFVFVFLVSLALGTALSHLIRKSLEKAKMLAYDRLLGGVLGVVKGGLLAVILIQVALNFTLPDEGGPYGISKAIIQSQSGNIARWSTEKILVFLPPEMAQELSRYDRLHEPEEPDQPDPADQTEQPGLEEQPGQPDQPGQPEQPGRQDQPGPPDQPDQPGRPEEPEQPE